MRKGYLRELETTLPVVPEWQRTQIRQALDALCQGVDHWHWERTQRGGLEPRFRLKTGEAERVTAVEDRVGPEACEPDEGRRPLRAGEDWRDHMCLGVARAALRVAHGTGVSGVGCPLRGVVRWA